MNLIIVESPTKAKTISGILGKSFNIESSYGHIRDLPKSRLGIDIENDFKPQYLIPLKSRKRVNELKKQAAKANKIILATDEDREGEAIAWHIAQILNLGEIKNQKSSKQSLRDAAGQAKIKNNIERIAFHEITKKAIEEALKSPRGIDMNLVDAQQARRVLDRLVGYKLSPFLWKKVMSKLSAGRVQSVALRIVVDREREIRDFQSQKYWTIEAMLRKIGSKEQFISLLYSINGERVSKPGILEEKTVQKVLSDLEKTDWRIQAIQTKDKIKSPYPPFATSSLQQAAWNLFKFSAKKTMMLAQQLYEGIILKNKGAVGLITYMRTDSLNLSEEALASARDYLAANFGKSYVLSNPRRFKTKSKSAQEAHEAIRPTDINLEPDEIKDSLSPDQYKLYKLIWQRFLASQMPPALFEETVVEVLARPTTNYQLPTTNYLFQSKGLVLKFDGFLKVYPLKIEEETLPILEKDDSIEALQINSKKHETQPPPRYNEASLIKILEKYGIGRPSTYAPTISVIQERGYVLKNQNKNLEPAEIGITVTDLLKEHFAEIVDINFTAKMEDDLDKIAKGEKKWQPVIKEFYGPFEKNLELKYEEVVSQKIVEETEEICEKCGKPLVIKLGRFGKFMACSGFPECKFTKPLPKETFGKCSKCGEGEIVERKMKKRNKNFYGCSRFPKCDFASWEKPAQA